MDFLFTGAVNWYRDLSFILQACIKAEKDGSVARFWPAIFYCFKVVAVTPESGGSVVKNTSAVQEILIWEGRVVTEKGIQGLWQGINLELGSLLVDEDYSRRSLLKTVECTRIKDQN